MKNNYFDLIDQTYYFPQEGFDLRDGYLSFHGVSLKYLIDKYGTPFKLTYLPRIGEQIKKAKNFFNRAIKSNSYRGEYYYCYCTKCCHFSHVINEALKHDVHLETSSSFDIDLIHRLYSQGKIDKKIILIHNGYKTQSYLDKIIKLREDGFENSLPVIDNRSELEYFLEHVKGPLKIGLRMAIDEEPQSAYYTSRLGIRSSELVSLVKEKLKRRKQVELTMLHFFVDTGIRDNLYYWGEFKKGLKTFLSVISLLFK